MIDCEPVRLVWSWAQSCRMFSQKALVVVMVAAIAVLNSIGKLENSTSNFAESFLTNLGTGWTNFWDSVFQSVGLT